MVMESRSAAGRPSDFELLSLKYLGQGMMGQGMMGQGMMGCMGMMTGPMLEGRLAYIKAELAITDAQAAAWNGYASAVKPRMSGMQGMHEPMMQAMQSGTAAARMDAHIKAMEEALKALKPPLHDTISRSSCELSIGCPSGSGRGS